MKRIVALIATAVFGLATTALAGPEEDRKAFRAYFANRFPSVPMEDYVNGVYALDQDARSQWEAYEEFPPYEINVDHGKKLFETPFANGTSYADCFPNGGIGISQNYPQFDTERGEVVTLELAIKECREKNDEKALGYGKDDLADIAAYMSYTSRGNVIDVKIPDHPDALAWYERGKRHFYAKRGQLNLACADCHVLNPGRRLRAETLGPALGQTTHFPVYRSKWGGLGTLHRRYSGCNAQVRATNFPLQGAEYRALEYFHTYMSNGLIINGPGVRR